MDSMAFAIIVVILLAVVAGWQFARARALEDAVTEALPVLRRAAGALKGGQFHHTGVALDMRGEVLASLCGVEWKEEPNGTESSVRDDAGHRGGGGGAGRGVETR